MGRAQWHGGQPGPAAGKDERGGSIELLAGILYVQGELERLETLRDTRADEIRLLMMDERLSQRIRVRYSKAGCERTDAQAAARRRDGYEGLSGRSAHPRARGSARIR